MADKLRYLLVLGVGCLLASCASSKHFVACSIDPNEKTIAMAAGSDVIFDLKNELRQRGWVIYSTSHRVTDKVSEDKMVTHSGNARYSLSYKWKRVDVNALTWQPMLNFNASLIDNSSGMEVLSYEAKRTDQDDCVEEFIELIEKNTKH